jgi:hypothetical protein
MSLSAYSLEHPENTLDKVLDKVQVGLENGGELFKLIPDSPFPARSLVESLAHLIKLGIVSQASSTWSLFSSLMIHVFICSA